MPSDPMIDLIKEVARLDSILRDARGRRDEAQAVIDSTINDYVEAKNRLDQHVEGLIASERDFQ